MFSYGYVSGCTAHHSVHVKAEEKMWERVLTFHHVGPGD